MILDQPGRVRSACVFSDEAGAARRACIFVVYDPQGVIDRYIPYLLRDLAENLSHLLVVVNGALQESGRARLEGIATDILVRENVGYDAWAYKEGLEHIGWDELGGYDEVLLMNDTVFGPVYPFREAFDAMAKRDVDFWGMARGAERPLDPFRKCKYGFFPSHIQSYFTVIRKPLLGSADFRGYWDALPMVHDWEEAVSFHEVVFTKTFEDKGFHSDVYIKTDDMGECDENALMYDPLELVQNRRCPVFKRKNFSRILGEYVDVRCGQAAWGLLRFLESETDYDVSMVWEHVLRVCNMADIKMRSQLNFILPVDAWGVDAGSGTAAGGSGSALPRSSAVEAVEGTDNALFSSSALRSASTTAVLLMRLSGLHMLETLRKYAANMPGDILISVPTEANAKRVRAAFEGLDGGSLRVVVPGEALFAADFWAGFREAIGQYDCACFIHDEMDRLDKPFGENKPSLLESFAYRCYENVLPSRAFARNVIRTFAENPRLGLLVPPPPNHGAYSWTVGNEWRTHYAATKRMADRLGLSVDMSPDRPPIAAFGHCFWFGPVGLFMDPSNPSGLFTRQEGTFDPSAPDPSGLFIRQEGASDPPAPPALSAYPSGLFVDSSGRFVDPDPAGLFVNPDRPLYPLSDNDLLVMERLYPFIAQSRGYYTGWLLSDVFAKFELTSLYSQLGDCYQALYETFGAMDHLSTLRRIRAGKSVWGILREKKPLWERMKLLVTKCFGTRGYDFMMNWRNENVKKKPPRG